MNAASQNTRHQRAGELFLDLVRMDPSLRAAYLDSHCGSDADLRRDVESLLAHAIGDAQAIRTGALDVGAVFDAISSRDDSAIGTGLGAALSSVARYRIVRVLGEGGMGTVYLAEQDKPRRTVALKVMRASVSNAERLRKRFSLEAEILGRLEDPGIARIYDAGTATVTTPEGTVTVPYFAMEFVDGVPISDYVTAQSLGMRDRLRLVAKVAHALGAAHRLGIVHRDIKPGNVLVDRSGQPKVLDFGVARASDAEVAVTTVRTDVGQLIGTLAYMSPEQVEGDPTKITVRSDVYALGAMTYELLTGKALVDAKGKTVAEVARIIRDEEPTKLSSVDRVFRGDLDTIVTKAIEKDPDRRYPDAFAFAADVDRYLADEPIIARPPTTMYQLRKFAKRNRVLVAGVLATFVALVIGLVGTTIGFLKARDQARIADEQTLIAKEQARIASEQARIAERRFGEVRSLANKFIYDVHDRIVDLPGSTEARKSIVETALIYLDNLAKERGDDQKLAIDLSEAYLKVGAAQGYGSRANLGDRTAARQSFLKALDIRKELVDRKPDDEEALRSYARVLNQVANLDIADTKFDDAAKKLGEGKAIREKLLARKPDDPASLREVAVSEQWIGNLHRERANTASRGDDSATSNAELELALAAYTRYADLMAKVATSDPKSRRDVTVGHEKIGDALSDLKRSDEAIAQYKKSLELREQLAKENPDSRESQRDYNVALGKVGARLLALGKAEDAAPFILRSYERIAAAVDADKTDVLAKTDLAVTESRVAELAIGRFDQAKAEGRTADPKLLDQADEAIKRSIGILEALDKEGKLDAVRRGWIPELAKSYDETKKRRESTGS
ncbi:MAG: protein kinase [Phycisphaerae bacterium]|nr:protein kinase [Phycisphaerae bacterium]